MTSGQRTLVSVWTETDRFNDRQAVLQDIEPRGEYVPRTPNANAMIRERWRLVSVVPHPGKGFVWFWAK